MLFYREGRLVVDATRTLEDIYQGEYQLSGTIASVPGDRAFLAWGSLVEAGAVTSEGLRFAFWARAAPTMHHNEAAHFLCPLCRAPCCGWGSHLWHS